MKSTILKLCAFCIIVCAKCSSITAADYNQSNITILHEVNNEPLELNTHEVLPSKPVKKKPYAILEKPSEFIKVPVAKTYNAHTVAFDFNLGDLEDVHETILPEEDLSSEERHLLRNTNDEDLTFSEESLITPSAVSTTYVTPVSTEPSASTTPRNMSNEFQIHSTESSSTVVAMTSTDKNSATPVSVASISPHIFKIFPKNKKTKTGHEFIQKDEQQKAFGNHFNSISTFFGEADGNATHDALLSNANIFQLMVNLYDQFYWQHSEIRNKVSPACGVEIFSYLSALNSNYIWAQKAYDSSGHYRGQLFFENNKWLGQREFCLEVNRAELEDERKHFEFDYYVATIHITAWVPSNLTAELQLGECLPKSCTTRDVEVILQLDPHAQMLLAALASKNNSHINIKRVRTIPGEYCMWRDIKLLLFMAFCIILTCIILTATWYESELNERKRSHHTIDNIKVDFKIGMNPDFNVKAFEVYQMTQMNKTTENNKADVEADHKENSNSSNKSAAVKKPLGTGGEPEIEKQPCSDVNANHVELSGDLKKDLALHQKILLCFALQRNTATILSVDTKIENQTSCVHGLRVFSVLWTILVHTYLQMFTIGENRFQRVITERLFFYQFIGNATFSVDTFFFISGFLVTLLFLRQDKKKNQNGGPRGFIRDVLNESSLIIVYRYIRLTPAYLFAILFNELSLKYTFDRSVFQPNVAIKTCSDYWWRNILYINNLFPLNQICMIWSWYMANDMQFYIMATLVLVFSRKYFKITALIIVTLLVSSWCISGVISIHYNYTHKVANPFESFNFLYDKPWQRVGTYIVGMIAGYIVFINKTPPKVSTWLNVGLWTASLGLLFVIICGVWSGQLNVIATAFYVSVGHTAFGVGLMWIVLSCTWGLANPVNKVLSYPGLLPLSRLTYCTYLIHPVIMLLTSFQMEGTVHLNNLMIWTIFLGNAVISFAAAFFISVMLEAPVVRLLKLIFKK